MYFIFKFALILEKSSLKNICRLNKVHLPLLEMARTVKVSKEKAKRERAREAGDKKLADMKILREENQKRTNS